MDFPLAMFSHSDGGNPLGAVCATEIHFLTAEILSPIWMMICLDSTELGSPDCLARFSQVYQGISSSKILFFLLEVLLSSSESLDEPESDDLFGSSGSRLWIRLEDLGLMNVGVSSMFP